MAALADKRADLDLQISLLAKHEVIQLLALVRAMAEQMGVAGASDPEVRDLLRDVRPEQVLEVIEKKEEELTTPGS